MRLPIVFEPLFMTRVWGGDRLQTVLGKAIPAGEPIGESWELVDREEAQSVVKGGRFHGRTLHELWTGHREEVFGEGFPEGGRFPLLCKILDAEDRLSVQVHPPMGVAEVLKGEPKTEMWFILDARPGSGLFAGLRAGVTAGSFQAALESGEVEEELHRIGVEAGEAIFIPSGRIHAIGEGNLIVEIQQNSDTTYRVFDWNRLGLDGQPRGLHLEESMASIDFSDYEPGMVEGSGGAMVDCEFFRVEQWTIGEGGVEIGEGMAIFTVIEGRVECGGGEFGLGDFFLLPAKGGEARIKAVGERARVLRTSVPLGGG